MSRVTNVIDMFIFEVSLMSLLVNMRFVTRSTCIYHEKDQNRAGQTESPVRDLVGRMEKRRDAPKFRAEQSVHEGIRFAEAIPASVGIRQRMHNFATFRHEIVLDVGQKIGRAKKI